MDNKQRGIIYSAIIKMFIVIYLVVFVIGTVKLFRGYSPQECLPELLLIFLMPVIGYFFLHSRRRVYFPPSIAGLKVTPQQTMKALIGRIKAYVFDSLQYSIVIVILILTMDLWDAHSDGSLSRYGSKEWIDTAIRMLAQFMGFCAAYFAIDFVIYETKAKKYMKQKQRREQRKKKYREKMAETGEESSQNTRKEISENDGE